MRLRWGYFITCKSVVKDENGEVDGDPLHLRSGDARRQRAGRTQSEIDHSLGLRDHAVDAEVRLYDTLFTTENPEPIFARSESRLRWKS